MFIPKLIVCFREGYSFKQWLQDLQAGFVVGLVALPLAMAFAIASGLPPERGLYTAIVAGFLISALGGSRVQIGGPTGAFVSVVAGIVAQHGYEGLAIATFMGGVILIVMGLSRLGTWVKYIPNPVITGFTSGIAVVIFRGQLSEIIGRHHAPWNPWALALSTSTALGIFLWPKSWKKFPAPVAALLGMTAIAALAHLPVETIQSRFGAVAQTLPAPSWPDLSLAHIGQLLPAAITIALLGAIESLLSAMVADRMMSGRHKSNLELVSQGIANMVSPIFGGIPATGAIARTATNIQNGGRTPVAGMTHALVLLGIIGVAGAWVAYIPMAVLSGILIVVCFHMFDGRRFRSHLKDPVHERVVLLATFLLTVTVNLTVAVSAGLALAAVFEVIKRRGSPACPPKTPGCC